jgi:hypothetical protein
MNRLLLFFLLFGLNAGAQHNYLFIKKGGKKKRTYTEGASLHVKLSDGTVLQGRITMLRNDTIFLNDIPVPSRSVVKVILHERKKKPFPANVPTVLAIGAGVGLTTIGLTLNDKASAKTAVIAASVIGFGPLIIKYIYERLIYMVYRKKFRIGKRYRLQVFDLSFPTRRSF